MCDIAYVVELAKAYDRAAINRDELQEEIHRCSLDTVAFGVNAFAEEFGDGAASAFVVAAALPIFYERVTDIATNARFAPAGLNPLPDGYWYVDEFDERVKEFSPDERHDSY